MDTKNVLLKLIHQAQLTHDDCLREVFTLIKKAVIRSKTEDIDWYIMNDMSDNDVLLLIVLSDTELSVSFNEFIIVEAVRYIFRDIRVEYH